MAITVGDKEVYKIIQNGKLQRVVNKGDKQLFRGDQLSSSYVTQYETENLLNRIRFERVITCAMLDNDLFAVQTANKSNADINFLYIFKRKNDEFELIEMIDRINIYTNVWLAHFKISKTAENNIAFYGIDGYIYLFDENGKFILKESVPTVLTCHTDNHFFCRHKNDNEPLQVLDLNYNVIGTYKHVVGMAIFDNGKQIHVKEDGVYLFENNKETLIRNFEEENVDLFTSYYDFSYSSNKDYFAFVTKYRELNDNSKMGHAVFLFNKNGEFIYRTILPFEPDDDRTNTGTNLFLDEYNAVYIVPRTYKSMYFFKLDLDGNTIDMPGLTKRDGDCVYVNKKQEFARITYKESEPYSTFYKNRHLK